MALIQFLIIAFAIFVVTRIVLNFRKGQVSLRGLIFWLGLWLIIIVGFVLPQTTTFLARIFGIARGADVAIYLSVVLLFYLTFKIFIKLEKIESDISKIVREIALKSKEKEK